MKFLVLFIIFFLGIFPLMFLVSPIIVSTLESVAAWWHSLIQRQHWPSLALPIPKNWERIVRWAGYRRGVPSLPILLVTSFFLSLSAVIVGGLLGGVVVLFITGGLICYIKIKARRTKERCRAQMPDMLQSMVDSLRAGYSWPQAVALVAGEAGSPTKEILAALVRADCLRLDGLLALKRVADQVDLPEWNMMIEALAIQQTVGGNIIPLLEEIGKTIREQAALSQEVKTATAAGRLSGWIIAGLVPVILIFFFFVSPAYAAPLFVSTLGRWLLALAAVLEIIGFIWIYRLVRITY